MKYKCLVCGQIIDNNEMCPFCGSDSSQIVPIESEGKVGHYRCLVCGRETENGDYCPYCGSQRLYNLDSRKVENTTSINIQNGDSNGQKPQVNQSEHYEHVHYENKNSFLFNRPEEVTQPQEIIHEENQNVVPEQEFAAQRLPDESENHEEEQTFVQEENESFESRYFNMFGELLPLESIQNPDPEKVEILYRIGVNRGSKITPEEIASTFMEEENVEEENQPEGNNYEMNEETYHDEENVAPEQENFIREPEEVIPETEEIVNEVNEELADNNEELETVHQSEEEDIDPEMTNHSFEENIYDENDLEKELYSSVSLLLAKGCDDEITTQILSLLKDKSLSKVLENTEVEEEENKVLSILDALVAKGNETNNSDLLKYKKFLDLFRVLFDK